MAYCINCGQELTNGAKYCANCGKTVDKINDSEQRKTIFDGDLHKCPKCGEHLNAFVTTCPVCNYELRGTQTTSYVHELSLKIEKTESVEQKIELISNFYIPNTKEDIYEFFILAYSNITAGGYDIDAWSVKLEQAYLKAKLAFGDSKEYEHIKELYENINRTSIKKKITKTSKSLFLLIPGLLMFAGGLIIEEILNENNIYMADALYPIAFVGVLCFVVGLILFVLPNKKRKIGKKNNKRK